MKTKNLKNGITAPKGFRAAGMHCGIKKKKKDLALVVSLVPATTFGIFTKNRIKAAPVILCQNLLKKNTKFDALLINSGNANCMTGKKGYEHALKMAKEASKQLHIEPHELLIASTGVIGREFPFAKIKAALPQLVGQLSEKGGNDAAWAILTTDTKPKERACEFVIDGKKIKIGIMAKGAGMISPDMATLIIAITTDLHISHLMLKRALRMCSENTVNAMTVDGDMSTNDSVFLMANGLAGNEIIAKADKSFQTFVKVLGSIMKDITLDLLADAEGVTKTMEVHVNNANTLTDAKKIATTILNSSLVKTALHGNDPNWGRIASSAGAAGVAFSPEELSITIGKHQVVAKGQPKKVSLPLIKKEFKKKHVLITVSLNSGDASYVGWGVDLSKEYVSINADYTT